MASSTPQIKKVPPFMNELLDIYNFCHSGINVIENCIFGRLLCSKDNIRNNIMDMYQIYIIHYQLCNKEKMYKLSCVHKNFEMLTFFFDRSSKMYLSEDGKMGCLFSTDENKLRIDTFENDCANHNFFLNCKNNVTINDLHKKFLFSNNFCSFNSNNTLLIYCAVNDDIRIPKETQMSPKEYKMLKIMNDNVYTETFGEKHTYSFFYLYVYNFVNNTVKPLAVKDISSCYYNPQFIDDSSFVCLSYQTDPFRLGIYAFNSRPNHLYLCTLNEADICMDKENGNDTVKKRNDVRCACIKISTKHAKHTLSPIVIHDKEKKFVYIACLTVMPNEDECWQHINECNLVLIKLVKENDSEKSFASSAYGEGFKRMTKDGNVCEGMTTDILSPKKNKKDVANEEECERCVRNVDNEKAGKGGKGGKGGKAGKEGKGIKGAKGVKEEGKGNVGKIEKAGNYSIPVVDEKCKNVFTEHAASNDIDAFDCSAGMISGNSCNNSSSNSVSGDYQHRKKRNTVKDNNKELCAYKKIDTVILVRAGKRTEFFRGIYTDEIKGHCFPYIFLNTILYCNRICIAVHMFTKKIYRIVINCGYGDEFKTSMQILSMKTNHIMLIIKNCLVNSLLYYCLFDETLILGDYIYLTPIQSYSLDFSDFEKIQGEPQNILYNPDNKEKLFLTLKEVELNLFHGKHPYMRRKKHDFNLLFQKEEKFHELIKEKNLVLPNFNLFNKVGSRNLVLFLHGGPYSVSLNEFRSIYIFFVACGFDIISINYTGSLTFDSQTRTLNGKINTIEVDNIISILKEFTALHTDYEQIFIYGGSYGGNLGCALLEKYNMFKGACLINGVYDWTLSAHSSDVPDYFYNLCLNKDYNFESPFTDIDLKTMRECSPIHFVNTIQSPVMLVCSKNDYRVSYHNSLTLYNKLRGLGKKCKLLLFEDDGHGIEKYKNEESMLINVILWFYGYDIKKKK